jgi:hypothetical protein
VSAIGQERTLWQLRHYGFKTEDDMVYLALTQQGLREILDVSKAAKIPIWCGADALSEAEFQKLGHGNVTRFTYSFANADKATIRHALATIEEHHPGERVWVESVVFET